MARPVVVAGVNEYVGVIGESWVVRMGFECRWGQGEYPG